MLSKRIGLLAIILLGIFTLFTYSVSKNKKVPFLYAKQGQIAVDCNSLLDSPYLITGEWRVYQGLFSPSELEGQPYSFTNDIRYIHDLAGYTYALELKASNFNGYYIMLPEPNGCRLWVDGIEVETHNKKGIIFSSLALPSNGNDFHNFLIVFQVSAFGGLEFNYQLPLFGTFDQLNKVQVYSLVDSIFSLGIASTLFINAITLFAQKRSEKYLLYFAGAIFVSFIIIPNTTPFIRINWEMFTISVPDNLRLVVTDFLRYFRSFLRINILLMLFPEAIPQKYIPVLNYCITYAILIQAIASVFFPGTTKIITFIFMSLYLIDGWIIIHGFLRKHRTSTVLLIGFFVFLGSIIVNYFLISKGLIPHHAFFIPLIQNLRTGILFYLITIAIAINWVFAQKYRQADSLATNLGQKVIENTAAIEASQEKINLIQKRKRDFISGIVHNLNSSLFTLGGYIEILKDSIKIESRDTQLYLNRIDAQVEHIKRMAADIFLMERLDDGNIKMTQELFDLVELCNQIINDHRQTSNSKNFNLKSSVETAYYIGDRFYLKQAIENLISNAIRFSREEGMIEISLEIVDGKYHLSVSDNGLGISADDMPHIFERYYSKKIDGKASTGLGLPISKEIVNKLGGTISATSTPGVKTVFLIQLPIPEADNMLELPL